MPILKLSSVSCQVPNEDDKDEMFLKINGQKIWPKENRYFKIDVDETVPINLRFKVTVGWIKLELWDYDFGKKNNHLGNFHFKVENKSGVFSTTLTINDEVTKIAEYVLNWETEEINTQ